MSKIAYVMLFILGSLIGRLVVRLNHTVPSKITLPTSNIQSKKFPSHLSTGSDRDIRFSHSDQPRSHKEEY